MITQPKRFCSVSRSRVSRTYVCMINSNHRGWNFLEVKKIVKIHVVKNFSSHWKCTLSRWMKGCPEFSQEMHAPKHVLDFPNLCIDNIFSSPFDWRKIIYKVAKSYPPSINWWFDFNHEVGSCHNHFISVSVVFSNKLLRRKNWRQFQSSNEKTEVCNTKSNWLVVCYKFLSDISSPRTRHIFYRKCSILIQLQPHRVSLTYIT